MASYHYSNIMACSDTINTVEWHHYTSTLHVACMHGIGFNLQTCMVLRMVNMHYNKVYHYQQHMMHAMYAIVQCCTTIIL